MHVMVGPSAAVIDNMGPLYLTCRGMRPDLIRGHLELVLLGILSQGAGHGYEIITRLRDRTEGTFDLNEGSVYPALHRLEDAGLLASDWQPVTGRRRRIYRVTNPGLTALAAKRREFTTLVSAVEAALGPAAALSPA